MEIVIILFLIFCNGLFAMSEIAILASRKTRLQQWALEGNRKAQIALDLAKAPDRFLSTVQTGITLIGILAGAFGGATIAQAFEDYLKGFPGMASYRRPIALGTVVLSITFISIVLGELVPKRLALNRPETIATAVAPSLRLLAKMAYPMVQLLTLSSRIVFRLLGLRSPAESPISEEEIKVLIDQGTKAGIFVEAEKDIVKSVFRLADREVARLMTPRLDIVWLDLTTSFEEIRDKMTQNPYSRFPVGQGSLDNVLGVVRAKDVMAQSLAGTPLDLQKLMTPPLFVPENLPALRLLELFKRSRPHLALVVDEYGGIQGLVTLNDLLESIVGDIPSFGQPPTPQAIQREDGSWLLDGMLPIDELKDWLKIGKLPGDDAGHFQTLGGFMMMQMGRIPSAAEYFEWGGFRFEVMDMDGKRVDKVLVVPL